MRVFATCRRHRTMRSISKNHIAFRFPHGYRRHHTRWDDTDTEWLRGTRCDACARTNRNVKQGDIHRKTRADPPLKHLPMRAETASRTARRVRHDSHGIISVPMPAQQQAPGPDVFCNNPPPPTFSRTTVEPPFLPLFIRSAKSSSIKGKAIGQGQGRGAGVTHKQRQRRPGAGKSGAGGAAGGRATKGGSSGLWMRRHLKVCAHCFWRRRLSGRTEFPFRLALVS